MRNTSDLVLRLKIFVSSFGCFPYFIRVLTRWEAKLKEVIEKILVHEAVKNEDGSREQEVEIFYRFIGKID